MDNVELLYVRHFLKSNNKSNLKIVQTARRRNVFSFYFSLRQIRYLKMELCIALKLDCWKCERQHAGLDGSLNGIHYLFTEAEPLI